MTPLAMQIGNVAGWFLIGFTWLLVGCLFAGALAHFARLCRRSRRITWRETCSSSEYSKAVSATTDGPST